MLVWWFACQSTELIATSNFSVKFFSYKLLSWRMNIWVSCYLSRLQINPQSLHSQTAEMECTGWPDSLAARRTFLETNDKTTAWCRRNMIWSPPFAFVSSSVEGEVSHEYRGFIREWGEEATLCHIQYVGQFILWTASGQESVITAMLLVFDKGTVL